MVSEERLQSEQVREDANDVLNASVSYAKRMLRRYGEFGPFGVETGEESKDDAEEFRVVVFPQYP